MGRNPDKTDIPILDNVISRVHAEISNKDKKIYIKDLESGKKI